MDKINQAFDPVWAFLHRGHIVRRGILLFAVWMTYDSYQWAKAYAATDNPSDFIFTAVLGVSSSLLAAAIGFYNSGRNSSKAGNVE